MQNSGSWTVNSSGECPETCYITTLPYSKVKVKEKLLLRGTKEFLVLKNMGDHNVFIKTPRCKINFKFWANRLLKSVSNMIWLRLQNQFNYHKQVCVTV